MSRPERLLRVDSPSPTPARHLHFGIHEHVVAWERGCHKLSGTGSAPISRLLGGRWSRYRSVVSISGAQRRNWYDPDVELPLLPETWDAIRSLLERPWSQRLWVVREIKPGAVVQAGFNRVPVVGIAEAIYCLYSNAKPPPDIRRHLEHAVGILARLPALCFTRLLCRASTFQACTDPRDKIFPARFTSNTARAHYSVSNATRSDSNTERPSILKARGVRCGLVSSVTNPLSPRLERWKAINHVRRWQPEGLDSEIHQPTGEPLRRVYAITLICNALKEREPDWNLTSTETWIRQDWDEALLGDRAQSTSSESSASTRGDVAEALQCGAGRLLIQT